MPRGRSTRSCSIVGSGGAVRAARRVARCRSTRAPSSGPSARTPRRRWRRRRSALQAFRATGVRVICARSFNHSGVGHGAQYLLPALVARVRDIAAGAPARARDRERRDARLSARRRRRRRLSVARRARAAGRVYNVAADAGVTARAAGRRRLAPSAACAPTFRRTPRSCAPPTFPSLIGSPAKLARDDGLGAPQDAPRHHRRLAPISRLHPATAHAATN